MDKSPVSPFGWEYINDLSAITEDTDAVEFLLHRVERGQIYTWVGPLLLSVNPENAILVDLYDESHQRRFSKDMDMVLRNAPPHVYAIANRARYRLVQSLGKISQVIIISGESGTGKTFNARQILEFLANIDKNTAKLKFPDGATNIAHEIANVCPLVSAFSTAKTEQNPSSSRHGQLIQLQYKSGAIVGARVNSFLLERTRVTDYSNNFDIFYQLLSGLSHSELGALGLAWGNSYTILGENHMLEKQKYQTNFAATMKAMETLGFTQLSKDEIFQVLALLLHMGNIKFREIAPEHCTLDTIDGESHTAVLNTCRISKLQEHELEELLTTTLICPKSTRRRHTMYRRDLRTPEACRHRLYSIIRWIYVTLFHSLVDRINAIITSEEDNCNWLGILDIFGFETTAINGIEQLCINYTTECLQMYFMEEYLENGQRELEEEGLSVLAPPPTLSVYRSRLSVIEQSLFSAMNDACQTPKPPTASTVSQQLIMRQSNAADFIVPQSHSFLFNHYSRPVEYDIHDILEKNTDKVPGELSNAFYQTGNSLLKMISVVPDDIYNEQGRVSVKKSTTLSKLKSSMDSLMQELNKCDTHYVRCVRPRRLNNWFKGEFREQLVCSGIMDALPLARCKFPIRLSYQEFSARYHLPAITSDVRQQFEEALGKIMNFENIASLMHLGNRRIFLTENLFFELERYRKEFRAINAEKIADFWVEHKVKESGKSNPSEVRRMRKLEQSDISKPAIIVTRPSINALEGDDDVFSETKSPGYTAAVVAGEINNNVNFNEDIPKIALNDLLVDHMSPMNTRGQKNDSGIGQDDANCSMQRTSVHDSVIQFGDTADENRRSSGKDRYVNEWLRTCPVDGVFEDFPSLSADEGSLMEETLYGSPGEEHRFRRVGELQLAFQRCPKTEWTHDGNYVIYVEGRERLFYKNRILSKRRLCEVPLKFHTRKTCLVNSHYPPRAEMVRGLEDCL